MYKQKNFLSHLKTTLNAISIHVDDVCFAFSCRCQVQSILPRTYTVSIQGFSLKYFQIVLILKYCAMNASTKIPGGLFIYVVAFILNGLSYNIISLFYGLPYLLPIKKKRSSFPRSYS
jgi:hypothetical protein